MKTSFCRKQWKLLALLVLLLLALPQAGRAAVIDPATPFATPLPQFTLVATTETDKPLNHRLGEIERFGYTEEEYLLAGTANIYAHDASNAVEIASQGNACVTRILVRRPADARNFSGNVVVEIYNSTAGVEKDVEFIQSSPFLLRNGDIWIGITNSTSGIAALETYDAGNGTRRYSTLNFTDNGLAWDAISQLGALLKSNHGAGFLPDFKIRRIYAVGESGSAQALVLYINEIHPLTRLASSGEAFNSSNTPSQAAAAAYPTCDPHLVLSSEVPIMNLQTQNEIITDSEYCVRRADTNVPGNQFRLWEVAGAAHLTPLVSKHDNAERDLETSTFAFATYECAHSFSQNDFPKQDFLQSALADLYDWVDHGVAPPTAARITLTSATPPEFVLDAYGNVAGGLRSPFVDVPIYTFFPADTTVASSGPLGSLYCTLFGYKVALSEAQLIALYTSHEQYVQAVAEEAEEMRQERFLLDHSARAITRQAENADVP
jgi:Alpha/beta hydrolase domain